MSIKQVSYQTIQCDKCYKELEDLQTWSLTDTSMHKKAQEAGWVTVQNAGTYFDFCPECEFEYSCLSCFNDELKSMYKNI